MNSSKAITAPTNAIDAPRSVFLTAEDRKNGAYDSANLQKALEGMHQDGLVVLKGVADVEHVDALNKFMTAEADDILEVKSKEPISAWNQGVPSNFLQGPPVTKPELLFNDIYFNPYVAQVVNALLGPRPIWNFLTANTAIAGSKGLRQRVHKDNGVDHPLCPYYIIANVPLIDFSPQNGSTEFWLGSHQNTTGAEQELRPLGHPLGPYDTFVKEQFVEARRNVRPPIQTVLCRGDITLRDLRLYHAGMPNPGDDHRIMLALGYQASWYPNWHMTTTLPKSQGNFFRGPQGFPIDIRTTLVDEEDKFYAMKNNDFTFRPSKASQRD
ncbi:Kanamycin biosynthesis J [Hyphodiscus hymeniophilus]|uniref:Kanamycin biosynthesis J n=1 Tax=Hyphodiscus hymeniophilus TaxID=353542 RepID=A0A9P6SL81_9HELO|nr:Kanamycin biosynthesis J [Hyphodiscus hymeniophilus]